MEIPPVIKIALEERLGSYRSARELREAMISADLETELTNQSEWTRDHFEYVDSVDATETTHFTIAPSGALNPFSYVAKCVGESCTVKSVGQFVKAVGLYSETAVIPDPIGAYFQQGKKLKEAHYDVLFRQFRILEQIRPLVESKVLLFGDPVRRMCNDCFQEMNAQLHEATSSLVSELNNYTTRVVRTNQSKYLLGIQIPLLQPDHDHTITNFIPITKAQAVRLENASSHGRMSKTAQKLLYTLISQRLTQDVNTVFFEMDLARRLGSLLLAGSRAETLIISAIDRRTPNLTEIEEWEKMRTIDLPWIDHLRPEEVLILREEASKALPRLRELLRANLTNPSINAVTAINELRMQALEVQAELDSLNLKKERNYRSGMMGLAMSFVVYGFASQSPALLASSMATLLATLAHLRNAERDHEAQKTKLLSMPAYALLRARQIIAER